MLQVEFSLDDPRYACSSGREGQFGQCYDVLPNQSLQAVSWPNGSFDGDQVLEFLGTPDIAPGYCVLILLCYAIAFRIAAYVALRHCGKTTGATGTSTTAATTKCVCRKPRHYHQSQSHAQSHPGSESKQKAAADDNRRVIASGATEKVIEIELPDSARESQNHKQPPPKQKQTQILQNQPQPQPHPLPHPQTPPTLRRQLTTIDISEAVEPLSVSFDSISYEVVTSPPRGSKAKKVVRRILHNICGDIAAGTLLALMGPSGAGKTTLLNVLAQRYSGGKLVDGSRTLYSGTPATSAIRSRCGFVFQDDLLLGRLTVRETIWVAAQLKLPPETSHQRKHERVENMIQTLRLTKVADSVIGGFVGPVYVSCFLFPVFV